MAFSSVLVHEAAVSIIHTDPFGRNHLLVEIELRATHRTVVQCTRPQMQTFSSRTQQRASDHGSGSKIDIVRTPSSG
jgi:hypothetical protein